MWPPGSNSRITKAWPPVIPCVEVAPAMKKERVIGLRELSPLERFFDHTLSISGNLTFGNKGSPFLDRKEQLHLPTQSYFQSSMLLQI